jgi:hypothetical protein
MPCESYTLKWMFMYDTQVKNRQKTLAYIPPGFPSFKPGLFWKGTSKHMDANNLQRCHKCMPTACSIFSICCDLVGVCYSLLAYGLLNCAVGLNVRSEGWGDESVFLLLDWWNDFSRLSDNLSAYYSMWLHYAYQSFTVLRQNTRFPHLCGCNWNQWNYCDSYVFDGILKNN